MEGDRPCDQCSCLLNDLPAGLLSVPYPVHYPVPEFFGLPLVIQLLAMLIYHQGLISFPANGTLVGCFYTSQSYM